MSSLPSSIVRREGVEIMDSHKVIKVLTPKNYPWKIDNYAMNIKRLSVVSVISLALLAQVLPASAATVNTLIRYIPSVSATLDQGTITLVPPVSNSPAKFRVEIGNPAIAKADGLVVTILAVGSTDLTYVQDAVAGYTAARRPSHIYVRPGTPKLSPWADQSVAMTAGTFTLTPPVSTSNGNWTYSSSNPSVVSINGATATINDGGEAVITATQFATSSWLTASATKMVTITALTPTVTAIPNVSLSVNGISSFELKNPTSTSAGAWSYTSSNPGVIAVGGNKFTAIAPGSVTVTAKQARSGAYRSYSTTFKIDVVAITAGVSTGGFTSTNVNLTSGEKAFSLYTPLSESPGAWEVTSSDPAVVRVNSISATNEIAMTALKAGSVTLTAVQRATGTFAQSAPFTVTITVKATPVVIAPALIDRVAGDPVVSLKAPASASDGAWSYTSSNPAVASIAGNQLTIGNAGSAVITATQAATATWNSVSTTFEVRVAGVTPTLGVASEVTVAAGAKLPASALPLSNSSGKWVFATENPAIVNIVNGEVVGVAVGSAKISAYQEPAGKYGRSNTVMISVSVTAAPAAPKPTATPTPTALKPVAGASLSGRTITVIAKNVLASQVKVTINRVAAKLGANVVKSGTRNVVVTAAGKVIYTKQFVVK